MPRLQRKSFANADEVRTFQRGQIDVVRLDEIALARFKLQPGWRWSVDVSPTVRTQFCQNRHVGYAISGSIQVSMVDGTALTIQAGDSYEIPPGHEVLVFGDEPWESIEFASAHTFGLAPEELGERVLATILFSDIVDSTRTLERIGDHAWANMLRKHNERIRAAIDRFRGREIASTGDGFLALFDGAAKAVRAGAIMDPALADLGLRVRVGLHTCEIEIVGGQPRGIGVHTAARVAALAGPGDVLVSGTTHDLLDGSGLSLEPRGECELKGLSGTRPVFALRRGPTGNSVG
jgi:class 3 adenylate cyclase